MNATQLDGALQGTIKLSVLQTAKKNVSLHADKSMVWMENPRCVSMLNEITAKVCKGNESRQMKRGDKILGVINTFSHIVRSLFSSVRHI